MLSEEARAAQAAYKRNWKKLNPDKVREEKRRYRQRHPEKAREATRRWKKAHPDLVRAQKQRYWERKAIQSAGEKPAETEVQNVK